MENLLKSQVFHVWISPLVLSATPTPLHHMLFSAQTAIVRRVGLHEAICSSKNLEVKRSRVSHHEPPDEACTGRVQ